MPAIYPVWSMGTPHIDSFATIRRIRPVSNVSVIEVEWAIYRGCLPIKGFFELVNPLRNPRTWRHSLRAEVYCAWYGVKPPTCFPNIELKQNQYSIIHNWTGDVIDNLSS